MSYYKNLDILNNKRKQLHLDIKNLSKDNKLLQHLSNTSNNIDSLLESLFEDEGDLEENKILVQEMLEFHIASLKNLKANLDTPINENAKEQENVEEDEAVDVECEKCGWEWNTADSDESDKYICHKCGFDNSYRYANKANNDEIDEYDVENEQDLKEFITFIKEYTQMLNEADCGCVTEAEYRGRKVTLGKPMQGDIKKFKVYVKNNKGKVVKVNFGFGGSSAKGKRMNIKVNNPKRRAAYRARHHCDNPGPRTSANYWSCRKW